MGVGDRERQQGGIAKGIQETFGNDVSFGGSLS